MEEHTESDGRQIYKKVIVSASEQWDAAFRWDAWEKCLKKAGKFYASFCVFFATFCDVWYSILLMHNIIQRAKNNLARKIESESSNQGSSSKKWAVRMRSLHNRASGQERKHHAQPTKNIFDHNPFYCILWKSTVYLPHGSFKTRNATCVKTWRSQKSNSTFWPSFSGQKSESLIHLQMYRGSDSTNIQVREFTTKFFPVFLG